MPYGVIYYMTVRMFLKQLMVYLAYLAAPLVTGQITSYLNGDDAWWDQEIPFPFSLPRFMELHDNVQYDWYTGLEWIADPSAIGGIWGTLGSPASMTWDEALQAANDLNYGGFNDWRMPNINELSTLIDYGKDHPGIAGDKFPNTQSAGYWPSSMTTHGCENMFYTTFGTGARYWDDDLTKKKYIRPVRGFLAPWWKTSTQSSPCKEP